MGRLCIIRLPVHKLAGKHKNQHDIKARGYDIILNGVELGGGSIRIHDAASQAKVFDMLGMSKEDANETFAFCLKHKSLDSLLMVVLLLV